MTISENLTVEGWLEAPNIRPFLKGLFPSVESLCEAYPHPLPGWAALVGTSLPAPIYTALQGRWQPTGDTAGNLILDTSESCPTNVSSLSSLSSLSSPFLKPDEEISPEFAIGHLVSKDNGIIEKEGYRISASFELHPGDILDLVCDSGAEAWPIAVVAPYEGGNWFDLPPLGDVSKGERRYLYHAEAEERVRISCFGPAKSIFIRRNTLPFLSTSLRSVNGIRMSTTRRTIGAALHPDETTSQRLGYGVTDLLPLGSVRFLRYEGLVAPDEGESIAFLIFYSDDGVALQTYYAGAECAGTRLIKDTAGYKNKIVSVPSGATHVRACASAAAPYSLTSH